MKKEEEIIGLNVVLAVDAILEQRGDTTSFRNILPKPKRLELSDLKHMRARMKVKPEK